MKLRRCPLGRFDCEHCPVIIRVAALRGVKAVRKNPKEVFGDEA